MKTGTQALNQLKLHRLDSLILEEAAKEPSNPIFTRTFSPDITSYYIPLHNLKVIIRITQKGHQ